MELRLQNSDSMQVDPCHLYDKPAVDCILSDWETWGECDVSWTSQSRRRGDTETRRRDRATKTWGVKRLEIYCHHIAESPGVALGSRSNDVKLSSDQMLCMLQSSLYMDSSSWGFPNDVGTQTSLAACAGTLAKVAMAALLPCKSLSYIVQTFSHATCIGLSRDLVLVFLFLFSLRSCKRIS